MSDLDFDLSLNLCQGEVQKISGYVCISPQNPATTDRMSTGLENPGKSLNWKN
jgi:hypothetical protein